jgi:hypothetical protein
VRPPEPEGGALARESKLDWESAPGCGNAIGRFSFRQCLYLKQLWNEDGCPSERQPFCRTLERILTFCQREGIRYPAILLRRKKELERGTRAADAALAAASSHSARDPDCAICHGIGTIPNPGERSRRFCECYVRKYIERYNAKLRAAGQQLAEDFAPAV